MKYISRRDFLWIIPFSLALGLLLAVLQPGEWWIGWIGFSVLLLIGLSGLLIAARWADGGRVLYWMVALAFILRLAGGMATYLALPVNGHNVSDDRAGYVYTDAHKRDAQAWGLASSQRPILDAFSQKFATDQYGGLLAFSALIYRYFSPFAQRPLMMIMISGLIAALGIPFLWKAVRQLWGEKVALASGWIFALYPESILLGGSAMREPYLMAFSAFTLWGFVDWQARGARHGWFWMGLGVAGMLLVSPAIVLVTLGIFAGWIWFTSERGRISWKVLAVVAVIALAALLLLSAALNRQGDFNASSPLHVVSEWTQLAVKWDVYQLERGSGWVQKLFNEMPPYLRLPFVVIYGVLQPVLVATFFYPTTLTWQIIGILRGIGWYMFLPLLIFSFVAATGNRSERDRKLWWWLTVVVWGWVFFTALRGGGDQWDNPRYRAILFMWEAIVAGYAWVSWRETHNPWLTRIVAAEIVFMLVFGQWYASRYFHFGAQIPFAAMIGLIVVMWALILAGGLWWDRRHRHTTES